jgi:hypothetical protein
VNFMGICCVSARPEEIDVELTTEQGQASVMCDAYLSQSICLSKISHGGSLPEAEVLFDNEGVLRNQRGKAAEKIQCKNNLLPVFEAAEEHVESLMVRRLGIIPKSIPDPSGMSARQNVFWASKGTENCAELLLFFPARVPCGIWSRTLCIEEGLSIGSALPFLNSVHNKGIAILWFNLWGNSLISNVKNANITEGIFTRCVLLFINHL